MKKPKRKKHPKKPAVLKDVFELYRGDPVVASAVLDFFSAFVRLVNAVQAHEQFHPASEEDRERPHKDDAWPDPRRTAARRPRHDEPDDDEEDE